MKNLVVFVLFLSLFLGSANFCYSEEEKINEGTKISAILEKGIGQYKHENYDEALVTLKKAKEEEPRSSLAAYYLGLTYKQLQNYKEAVPPLKDAVTYTPKIKGALIELIDCLYQLGRLDEAKQYIAEAEREGIRPAQTAFLKGLTLLKDGKDDEAINSFKNAKELDKSMTQACDYQIGLAYVKINKYGDAVRVFKELVLVDPNTSMANFANEYMDAVQRKEEAAKPFKISAGAFWQYDDNVVLLPSDSSVASNISDKADSRQVYTGSAEYNYRPNDRLELKGQYFFYYAKQTDLGFYDTLSNTFVLQPSINFKNSLLTFPTAYNHTLVNDKAYLSNPSTAAVYNFMVGNSNMGQAFLRYQFLDYLWETTLNDENRTGNNFGGGIGWYFFFAKNKGFLNLRYGLDKDWTRGTNWEYIGNRASVSLLVPGSIAHKALDKFNITLSGDFYAQNFSKSHSFFHVYRRDNIYTLSALAAYKFYKDSEVQLQYTHVDDASNISIYKYNRNIYSVGVNLKF